jgi:hypothetical protein
LCVVDSAKGVQPMDLESSKVRLVKEVVVLLRAVRADLNSELGHTLGPSLDEAIGKLEHWLYEGRDDPGRVIAVLKVLAQGLAAVPAIQHLIEMMKGK